MGIMLKLELPNAVYEHLLKKAKVFGQTPEQIAQKWMVDAAKQLSEDPLLRLAGTFESNVTDISECHDKYIGQELENGNE